MPKHTLYRELHDARERLENDLQPLSGGEFMQLRKLLDRTLMFIVRAEALARCLEARKRLDANTRAYTKAVLDNGILPRQRKRR